MSKDTAFRRNRLALAIAAAFGTGACATVPMIVSADETPGQYLAGDFHNHTTCSDGSISMQKLVRKSMDAEQTPWALDWFVQAGHGGSGNRNCTLTEDETLATPAYPHTGQGPTTTWLNTTPPIQPKGRVSGSGANQAMWRWQSIQEFQYPLIEYLGARKDQPLFLGVETVVPGHEHTSMSVITGQIPAGLNDASLPTAPVIAANTSRYTAVGNADALAKWEYCFDRNDTDDSRGNTTSTSGIGNNWDCSVPGSANAADVTTPWSAPAAKLVPSGGAGTGNRGHFKAVESVKWMAAFHPTQSYYVPAHLERAGPFNPDGNNGFNVEHLRNLNNAGPRISFGMETQPGHGASSERGEYTIRRNNIGGVNVDSVGGTTYGGTGVYGAQIGGVWDALLGEGRNWWFFASSDWHNRGMFGPDDRRTSQDFYPGEYQRNYTLVDAATTQGASARKVSAATVTPQTVVDGLRTGNNFASSGQLIDRLAFTACTSSKDGSGFRPDAVVETHALKAAQGNTSVDVFDCANMGEKLTVKAGQDVVVTVVVRDPAGKSFSPYSFANPSLKQIGVTQPLDEPALDHIDLIRGLVTGYRTPGAADYAGEWPRNTAWLKADGTTTGLSAVPAAAKNTSTAVIRSFSAEGDAAWKPVKGYLTMTYRIPAVSESQYVRLRGTNLPAAVPFETDADGNPLADVYTNAIDPNRLTIPCTTAHSADSQFDGCPDHLETAGVGSPIAGQKAVSFDVAAWADLWFYSNPIYIEVIGSTVVAGVR
ncbi:MAG: hypothetical protein ACREUE_01625 [Panacagrimonas sp.]